jgi:serine/threonine-protein kinase
MAPEQIEGGEVDARADVFGVGVLLYECMVGHLPFDGSNPAQVLRRVLDGVYPEAQRERPSVGARWSKILDRALAHLPEDRFSDANVMRDALLAELVRLEVSTPDRDLAAWIDDPAAFDEAHRGRIVDRLCILAKEARKRGDVLCAAADYNRALANAPDDPNLLRIVAGMNRAERRARAMRRAGRIAGAVVALGGIALAGMRMTHPRPHPVAEAPSSVVPPAVPSDSSGPAAASGTAPSPAASQRPRPIALLHEAPRITERRVTLDLKPPMGVSVSIDGQPERGVSTGDALALNPRAHTLSFSCPVCMPVQLPVDAADRDSTLSVSVPVKPATLVVDGDVSRTYQVVEHPELVVRAGTNIVPLRSAYEPVTVKQIETGQAVSVRLEAARTLHVAFP